MIRSQRSVVGFQQDHDASATVPLSSSVQATPQQDELGTMRLGVRLPLGYTDFKSKFSGALLFLPSLNLRVESKILADCRRKLRFGRDVDN